MGALILPGLVLIVALAMTMILTWRDPQFAGPEQARDRRFATVVWPGSCLLAVGFMATLDYNLPAVLTGAAALYAGLCLFTGARPVVLFDRLLVAPPRPARPALNRSQRRSRIAIVVGVVALLTALVALDRSL